MLQAHPGAISVFQALLIESGQVDALLNDPRVVADTLTAIWRRVLYGNSH